nr:ECF transporter S component [Vagococcus elongatus]
MLAIFTAIIFLLSFTPIGFIQLGFIKATIIHVPVIIGSILLGPKKGAFLGFVFGLTSFISNTTAPVVSSFVFSPFIPLPGTDHGSYLALIICFVPRILTGVVPYFVYHFFKKYIKNKDSLSFAIAGVLGTMTNTLLVMNGIFFLFGNEYALVKDININAVYTVILSIIVTNGVMESIVAGVIVTLVCKSLLKNKKITQMLETL